MAGDELISMIDSEPIGIEFEGKWRSGILGRDGIVVGVEGDANCEEARTWFTVAIS